ncbi:MAG: hydrogenase iron-sulfur subunit, partial [Candidatus Geothermincolia bacterium]
MPSDTDTGPGAPVESGLDCAGAVDPGKGFSPTLAVFHCRWCLPDSDYVRPLLPAEAQAGSVLLQLSCSARMEAEFAIKAFAEGYDGVLVLGCEQGECLYRKGNILALKRLLVLRNILGLSGIHPERLGFYWVSPFDEGAIRSCMRKFYDGVVRVGPFNSKDTWSK